MKNLIVGLIVGFLIAQSFIIFPPLNTAQYLEEAIDMYNLEIVSKLRFDKTYSTSSQEALGFRYASTEWSHNGYTVLKCNQDKIKVILD